MPPQFTPDRWKTLELLLDAALELDAHERDPFVERSCAGDDALREELRHLLADVGREDAALDRPAAERFARLLGGEMQLPAVLVDRYRIEREVGRGGMATVYLATDLRHERSVAVKVFHPELAAALGHARFLAEIRTTARLQHPHILPLHDSGADAGFLFYVMPYVQGESLRHRLDREKQLSVADVVRIAGEVASALDAAHSHGVIHRDIKPENILLHNGVALVADFGIALASSEATPRLTQSGFALGTPQYMSPEQATADSVIDARSDVYALGAMVFEMLAGEPPFVGATPAAIVAKRAAMPAPPVRVLRAALPAAIEAAVARALARERVDRYPSAGAFANDLRSALDSPEAAPHSTSASWWRRPATVAIASIATAIAIGLIASFARGHSGVTPALDSGKIVVLPFSVAGADSSRSHLGEDVVHLLSPSFTGEGGLLAIDSRTAMSGWGRVSHGREANADVAREVARTFGAGEAVFGTLVFGPGGVTLTANVVDAVGGATHPLVPITGSADSLQTLLDGLAARILVRRAAVPDESVNMLITQSLPALRAYLDGRAAARRARNAEAVRNFTRALEIDSTFAMASLDLAITTTKLIRQARVCRNESCASASVVPGFRDTGPESDDGVFDRAIQLASRSRANLGSRDLPLLEALLHTQGGSARQLLADLERAAMAAPNRAEPQYFLGVILLYQGFAVGYSDPFVLAETRFLGALAIDSAYLAPLARLVDVAAFERDTSKLRRYGESYLARDSASESADYVRWRVAAAVGDAAALARIHARFDSLSVTTLSQIATASQMSGVALDDGERAARLVINRSADPMERGLYWGHMLALNRGHPRMADSLLRLRAEHDSSRRFFARAFNTWDAMFGQGDSAAADAASRERARLLARDSTAEQGEIALDARNEAFQEALWNWAHGRATSAAKLAGWLRVHRYSDLADVTDMLVATEGRRSDAAALRARVDSAARSGCCTGPNQIDLLVAIAYERAGDDSAALRAVRRGVWRYPTMYLSTYAMMEGHLAARVGDREGAIRAYELYLALRSDPEPHLVPQRDSVRAEVARLRSGGSR